MRICQLSHVEHTYNFLAPLVGALRDDGHEVVAACNCEHDGAVVRAHLGDEVAVHRVRVARRVSVRAVTVDVLRLARYLRRERFDVLHVHSPLVALQGRAAARLAGTPVVISQAHGFWFHDGMPAPTYRAHLWLEQVASRYLTDVLVTVSEEDHQLALRHRFRPPDRLVHVPGVGVDTDRFRPPGPGEAAARRRLRASLGAGDDEVVVTFVGRLVGDKGVVELLAAVERLPAHARMWLVGDVLATERDQRTAGEIARHADRDSAGRVRLLGRRTDVPDLLRASDVFALPSYREGLPVSLMEAMATGLPVVATRVRGCREVVVDGVSGLLVPPRDAAALASDLARLVDDASLRRRLGRAARERIVRRYATQPSLAPLLALYRDLSADPSRAGGRRSRGGQLAGSRTGP